MKESHIKYIEKEIKDIDQRQGIVSVYTNSFNFIDSDGQVSLPGSFTKTLNDNLGRMRWLLNHNKDVLLGVPFIDGGIQDSFGLLGNNKFNMQKEVSRDTFEDYKIYKEYDRSLEHSVRVFVVKSEFVKGNAIPVEFKQQAYDMGLNEIELVKEWGLMEITTMLTWGANEKTPLIDIKSLEKLDDTINFFRGMVKMNYTDERMKNIEETLNILLTLKSEPLKTTPPEPENNTSIEPLLKMINESTLFNLNNNGR